MRKILVKIMTKLVSNYSIWHQFGLKLVDIFHFHVNRPIMGKGTLKTPEKDETEGFGCLWNSNWSICCLLRKMRFFRSD